MPEQKRKHGFALLMKRAGRWIPVTDETELHIHEFSSKEEAHALYGTSDAVVVIDLDQMICV